MPVTILEFSNEQAAIFMVDSNCQREKLLLSEKAYAHKIKMDALRKQGQRTDLTLRPVVEKSNSAVAVGSENGESARQIQRFIRLTELVPPLLKMVDEGKIAFRPAIETSCLPKKAQKELLSAMEREVCTPSLAQAIKLKKLAAKGVLTPETITSVMAQQKPNQKEQHRIPCEELKCLFKPNTSAEEMNKVIIKALDMYRKRERSREQAR